MVGGEPGPVARLTPVLEALAPGAGSIPRTHGAATGELSPAERGFIHAGPVGAGHFVKMIHNGVEYGLMQAYAEGFNILRSKAGSNDPDERYELDLGQIAEVWRRGSVVSSWLLDLTAQALTDDAALGRFTGRVADSGEGRWTIEAALEQAAPADVLAAALFARFRSRETDAFHDRLLSAMRYGFGGHAEAPPG
jgi:6-phosphogluconate dehydrogenase